MAIKSVDGEDPFSTYDGGVSIYTVACDCP